MNKAQRRILIAAAVLVLVAFLFPPVYSRDDGFRYLFLPTIRSYEGRVDAWLLIAEFVAIGMLARIGCLLWAHNGPPK